MSTSFVDSLEETDESFLTSELNRLSFLEEDLLKSQHVQEQKLNEENKKLKEIIFKKILEHEKVEKNLSQLQTKFAISQPIVEELEANLTKLQQEAERAKK
jgi:hypothetical protein